MKSLIITPVNTTIQSEAKELVLQGLREHWGTLDITKNPDLSNIYDYYGDSFFVGYSKTTLVVTGALLEEEQGVGRIVRMSVSDKHRRKGFANQMVSHLIDIAQQRGYTKLLVETNDDWYAALALYKRNGFSEYKKEKGETHLELLLT